MSNDEGVSKHYSHGSLLKAIQDAITKLGKTIDSVTIEDLSPVDEFHIGTKSADILQITYQCEIKKNKIIGTGKAKGIKKYEILVRFGRLDSLE